MIYAKVFHEDKEVENDRLELKDKNTLYYLGRNLTLRNCTIVLKVAARNLFIRQVRFINCVFEVKQDLKNHQDWITAFLQGCRFKGRFSGCDFGHWPEYLIRDPEYQFGSIENCDFTEARLDGCRFLGCDPSTLKLPGWPCFTFLDPIARASELLSVKWPGTVGDVIIEQLRVQPARTKAVTLYAPIIAKQFETTPEEIKAVIEKFDCILS